MASRFPNSQHQRPPPPYPNAGGRGGGSRGGGPTFSSRGRGGGGGAGGTFSSSGPAGSQSAHPAVSSSALTASTASVSTSSSTPSTTSGSTSAPPQVVSTSTTQSTSTLTVAQQNQATESKILSNPNPVCLCKIGQGTIQDIVSMTQELFTYLKMISPANATTLASPAQIPGVLPIPAAQDKAAKAEEHLKEINLLFKKLKVIYKNLQPIPNVNDDQGLLLDIDSTEDLIPMKRKADSDGEPDVDEIMRKKKFESQAYMQAARELAEVKEKLRAQNEVLKTIIDDTRTTIWEINSILGMRKLGS